MKIFMGARKKKACERERIHLMSKKRLRKNFGVKSSGVKKFQLKEPLKKRELCWSVESETVA